MVLRFLLPAFLIIGTSSVNAQSQTVVYGPIAEQLFANPPSTCFVSEGYVDIDDKPIPPPVLAYEFCKQHNPADYLNVCADVQETEEMSRLSRAMQEKGQKVLLSPRGADVLFLSAPEKQPAIFMATYPVDLDGSINADSAGTMGQSAPSAQEAALRKNNKIRGLESYSLQPANMGRDTYVCNQVTGSISSPRLPDPSPGKAEQIREAIWKVFPYSPLNAIFLSKGGAYLGPHINAANVKKPNDRPTVAFVRLRIVPLEQCQPILDAFDAVPDLPEECRH